MPLGTRFVADSTIACFVKWFWVEKIKIIENGYDLSIQKYKPIAITNVKHESTTQILSRLVKLEKQIADGLNELRGGQ